MTRDLFLPASLGILKFSFPRPPSPLFLRGEGEERSKASVRFFFLPSRTCIQRHCVDEVSDEFGDAGGARSF